MEITIRGLSEKSLEELQNEFSKKSWDMWVFVETEEDYYTVNFFCEGICVLKEAVTVLLPEMKIIPLGISKTDYQDIEIR